MNFERQSFFFTNFTLNDFKQLAYSLKPFLKESVFLILCGEMGTGKTTFAHFIIDLFDSEVEKMSPSFPLKRTYQFDDLIINHFDFYRLNQNNTQVSDWIYLAEEFESSFNIIEWGENSPFLPTIQKSCHWIKITINYENIHSRKVKIKSNYCNLTFLKKILI